MKVLAIWLSLTAMMFAGTSTCADLAEAKPRSGVARAYSVSKAIGGPGAGVASATVFEVANGLVKVGKFVFPRVTAATKAMIEPRDKTSKSARVGVQPRSCATD